MVKCIGTSNLSLRSDQVFSIQQTKPTLYSDASSGVTTDAEAGPVMSAALFGGSPAYMTYTGTGLNFGTNDVTIAGCFYFSSMPGTGTLGTIIESGTIGNNSDFYWLGITASGVLTFYFCDGDRNYTSKTYAGATITAGRWYRFIVRLDRDGAMYITLDGITEDKGAVTQPNACNSGNVFVGRISGTAHYFTGKISGLLLVHRLLTPTEMAWLDNGGSWRTWEEFGQAGTDGEGLTNAVVKAYWGFATTETIGVDDANDFNLTNSGATVSTGLVPPYAVSLWNDLSGHANHLAQATGSLRPLLVQDSVNGRPSLEFANTKELSRVFASAIDQGHTIAIVAKATTDGGVLCDATSGDHCQLSRNANTRFAFNAGTELWGDSADAGWHVFILCGDGDTSIISVDGSERGGAAGAAGLAGILLGRDNAGANPVTGNIAAVAVWDRVLRPGERRSLGRYWARQYGLQYGALKVCVTNDEKFFARIPWIADADYIVGMDMSYTVTHGLDTVGFRLAGKCLTTRADSALVLGEELHDEMDDIAPMYFNGTYIGGDHAAFWAVKVNLVGHGKDSTDLGSEWIDGAGVKFYLMYIESSSALWFLSENTSETGSWLFTTTITGELTHNDGAAHTGSITPTTQARQSFFPCTSVGTRELRDQYGNVIPVNVTAAYRGDYFDVIHNHTIKDLDGQLAAARAGVGTAVDYRSSAIADVATREIRYRFLPNGAVTISETVTFHQQVIIGTVAFVQSSALEPPVGGSDHVYIPGLIPFDVIAESYDFEATEDITTFPYAIYFDRNRWSDADAPPDRFVQVIKDGDGNKVFGFATGYNSSEGSVSLASRNTQLASAAMLYVGSKKMYPYIAKSDGTTFPSGVVPAGTVLTGDAFRGPLNYDLYPTPTSVIWWYSNGGYYLAADFHADFDGYVATPPQWAGKSVSVVRKHANATVNSVAVEKAGVSITVTDSYGWAIMRIA